MRIFPSFALASGLLLFASLASAEGRSPEVRCELSVSPNGTSIPANVPALVVRRSTGVASLLPAMLASSGTPTGSTFRASDEGVYTFLAPDRALEPGTKYTLDVEPRCTIAVDGGAKGPTQASFTASPPVELPTSLGTLGNVRFENGHYVVSLTPSPELDAFMPVVRLDAILGGVVSPVIEYGGNAKRGRFDVFLPYPSAICIPNDTLVREATIELRAKVAGATTSVTPQQVNVLFDCAKYAAAHPGSDAGDDDSAEDGAGCQTAPAGATSALLSFALALTVAGTVRRARRMRKRKEL